MFKMRRLYAIMACIMALTFAAVAVAEVVHMTKRASFIPGYEYKEVIASGQPGNDVHIFPMGLDGSAITCTIIAGAGSGRFEYSPSLDSEIIAETAEWIPWDPGDVTGSQSFGVYTQIKGIRGVSVSGEIKIYVNY